MSKKLMSITVNGKEHTWSFNFYADPQYLDKWQADGLDIVQIENVIPMWVWEAGLTKPYCWLQDIFNFKWPWHK
jgi:hypothetical protein